MPCFLCLLWISLPPHLRFLRLFSTNARMTSRILLCIAASTLTLFAQAAPEIPWDKMDLGPFHTGCVKVKVPAGEGKVDEQIVAKGIAIKVGTAEAPVTVLFDPELLRVSAAWTGGFITFPRARGGLEGQIKPDGEVKFSTPYLPGWSAGEIADDPRDRHQGHLPNDVAKYRGLYVNGGKVILSYTVGKTAVLEMPGAEMKDGALILSRTIAMGAGPAVTMLLAGPGTELLTTVDDAPAAKVEMTADGKAVLRIPARQQPTRFRVVFTPGKTGETQRLESSKTAVPDLAAMCKGGPAQWGSALETKGRLGTGDGPYLVDDIPLPDGNPFHSWLRIGGHDFFPNGDAALVNVSGDVWVVSGLDAGLEQVKWKRFATGLFQPLGCKIVDGKIYVTGRDQITRLHDLNGDGEADYYECFNNDCVVTDNYHEFALDLQTDAAGNFYYAKGSPWTPTNTSPHQGTMLRVSKDGSKMDVIATGLRAPNGLGMGPKDLLTCSDNQGHWMPANRLNIVKPGGFYGMVPAAHKTLRFKAVDGTEFEANPSSEDDRKKFKTEFWNKDAPMPVAGHDLPLLWMPQSVDNSPGGEVWVSGGKWGPWEGRMLHMSYGHCTLYGVMMETVDGVAQGGVVKFPFKFPSGIMRGRFHPTDGQLYMSGLNVWQSDASKFGCFTRVRYTGKPVTMPVALNALPNGVRLTFTNPLEEKSATDAQNFSVEQWNYQWTGNYGSSDYSVLDPAKKGKDVVPISKLTLSADKKQLTIDLGELRPSMQMRLKYKIAAADGSVVENEIHNTIHRVPGKKTAP